MGKIIKLSRLTTPVLKHGDGSGESKVPTRAVNRGTKFTIGDYWGREAMDTQFNSVWGAGSF